MLYLRTTRRLDQAAADAIRAAAIQWGDTSPSRRLWLRFRYGIREFYI